MGEGLLYTGNLLPFAKIDSCTKIVNEAGQRKRIGVFTIFVEDLMSEENIVVNQSVLATLLRLSRECGSLEMEKFEEQDRSSKLRRDLEDTKEELCKVKNEPRPYNQSPLEGLRLIKELFAVVDKSSINDKIHAIKIIRALTGCGLREAKDFSEEALHFVNGQGPYV